MLAMSSNTIRTRPVESETEWRFVPPHLSDHVVPSAQLFGKTISVYVEDKTTNLEHLLHDENSCEIGDKSDDVSIVLIDPAVAEVILRVVHGISETVHVQLHELCFQ